MIRNESGATVRHVGQTSLRNVCPNSHTDRVRLTLTIDGREAATIGLVAHHRGVGHATTQRAIHRAVAAGRLTPISAEKLRRAGWDPRIPLFWANEVTAALDTRPGRGANLRGHT
jgi:hypothetical protein